MTLDSGGVGLCVALKSGVGVQQLKRPFLRQDARTGSA